MERKVKHGDELMFVDVVEKEEMKEFFIAKWNFHNSISILSEIESKATKHAIANNNFNHFSLFHPSYP